MAQTIAEKLAEKYDVTPSTTIAGTLKKITNDETGDVNIASLISKMEAGGGGSSRILVYENELNISSDGIPPIIYGTGSGGFIPPYCTIEEAYTLEVDGTVCATGKFVHVNGDAYALGLTNPGDSEGLANYSGGVVAIAASLNTDKLLYMLGNSAMLDGSKFEKGAHSVKIYKEA